MAASSTAVRRAPRAASRMMIPGVQKPHWLAPVSLKARAHSSRTAGSSPSSVVTARPATRRTGVTQATRAAPSIHTVQQPHCPWGLQPSLGVLLPRRSRSASRSEIPSSSTTTRSPSTVKRTSVGVTGAVAGTGAAGDVS